MNKFKVGDLVKLAPYCISPFVGSLGLILDDGDEDYCGVISYKVEFVGKPRSKSDFFHPGKAEKYRISTWHGSNLIAVSSVERHEE